MRRTLTPVFAVLLAGCAAGVATALYEFRPTPEPLRYQLSEQTTVVVETPQGNQRSTDTSSATIRLTVGDAAAGGRRVTAAYEALEVRSGGDMGSLRISGGDLIGRDFAGTLAPDGRITVEHEPAIPREVSQYVDPGAWLEDLFPPLPADPNAASWPVEREVTSEAAMTVTVRYVGVARFAGDTTWNGRAARIILFEGEFSMRGQGQPAGAPAPLEMSIGGKATRRFVWDARRGVMLAASSEADGSGVLELVGMNFSIPASATNRSAVDLLP